VILRQPAVNIEPGIERDYDFNRGLRGFNG